MSTDNKSLEALAMEAELELMSVALQLSRKEGMDEIVSRIGKILERIRTLAQVRIQEGPKMEPKTEEAQDEPAA